MDFDGEKLVEMLRRSYTAVDGLWFVMAEEMLDPEQALELDERVWRVMPKLQARKARQLLRLRGSSLAELAQCFALKLSAEGHHFEVSRAGPDKLETVITECPWLKLLERSDRLHMADTIAQHICVTEGRTWASEFSEGIRFSLEASMCAGDESCRFVFRRGTD